MFSILFPVMKLSSTGIHLLSQNIGLNGILESQLSNPVINNGTLNSQTITYTSLQPGYFIFAGFVVYGIVLFAMLKRMSPRAKGPGAMAVAVE